MKKVITILAVALSITVSANAQKSTNTSATTALKGYAVEGITWHALTLKKDKFKAYQKMLSDLMGLKPAFEMEGFAMYQMQNGSMLELYLPEKVPAYKYNGDIAIGFRVTDIRAASEALKNAGYKLLGDIQTVPGTNYSYRHFQGPDGAVFGLNEQK